MPNPDLLEIRTGEDRALRALRLSLSLVAMFSIALAPTLLWVKGGMLLCLLVLAVTPSPFQAAKRRSAWYLASDGGLWREGDAQVYIGRQWRSPWWLVLRVRSKADGQRNTVLVSSALNDPMLFRRLTVLSRLQAGQPDEAEILF